MKKFLNIFRIFISIGFLAGLVWIMRNKLIGIGAILVNADKFLVLVSFGLIFIGVTMQSYRLKFLLNAQNIHLKVKDLISLTFIGQFFNNFMPTSIGGDVIKAYYASGGTERKLETFTSVAMDRILGVITLMWIALLALVINRHQISNKMAVIVIIIMSVIGIISMVLIFNKKAAKTLLFFKKFLKSVQSKERIQRLYEATNKYRHHKLLIFHALWLSLAAQFVYFFMAYLLAISISSGVSFIFLLLTLPVISTISMLPSLNGLGIRESGFVYFLGGVMGKEKAFALSLLYLAVTLTVSLTGGIVFLFKREFKHIIKEVTDVTKVN